MSELKCLFDFLEKHSIIRIITMITIMFFTHYVMEQSPWYLTVIPVTMVISLFLFYEDIDYELWTYKNRPFTYPINGLDIVINKPLKNKKSLITGLLIIGLAYSSYFVLSGTDNVFQHQLTTLEIQKLYGYIIFAPIFEEIIFRGELYNKVLKPNFPPKIAFYLSVLIFTLFHLPQTLDKLVFYFIGSYAIHYVYKKTEYDLRATIVIHMIANIIGLL